MAIEAASVQFLIGQAGRETVLAGDPGASVERLRIMRSTSAQSGTLFLDGAAPGRSIGSEAACLYPAPGDASSATDLLEAASDALCKAQAWEMALKDGIEQGIPLDQLVAVGSDVLPYALALFDANLTILGASGRHKAWTAAMTEKVDEPIDEVAGDMPISEIANLLEDDEYRNAALCREPFYYLTAYRDGKQRYCYCINMFDHDAYCARLVVIVPDGCDSLPRGAEFMACRLAGYIQSRLDRFTGSEQTFGNQHDSAHELFRSLLFDGVPVDVAQMERSLSSAGWTRRCSFVVVKLVFFDTVRWDEASFFICRQLERSWQASCAIYRDRCIAWIVNESLGPSGEGAGGWMDSLVSVVRTYACKAGISSTFDDLAKIPTSYAQCDAALAVGQTIDPHLWYYRFDDNRFEYILHKAVEVFPADHVVSQKLLALLKADEAGETDYVKTLRAYLAHNQNVSHTASALFMHRTSLVRKLERMQRIAGIDFDDPEEVLFLGVSLLLLDR